MVLKEPTGCLLAYRIGYDTFRKTETIRRTLVARTDRKRTSEI